MHKINNFWVEDHGKPVEAEHREKEDGLESMPRPAVGVVGRVVVEGHNRLCVETVRVALGVIGEGVVGPVLLLPGPLVPTDDVGAEAKEVVDPGLPRGGAVVGIVLHVQTNEGLCHAKTDGHGPGRTMHAPLILAVHHKCQIEGRSDEISRRTKLPAATDDLKHLPLDFTLEWSVEGVLLLPALEPAGDLHLFQMMASVVRVDHLVLDRHVGTAEEQYAPTSGMVEGSEVIDVSIYNDLASLEARDRLDDATRVVGGLSSFV